MLLDSIMEDWPFSPRAVGLLLPILLYCAFEAYQRRSRIQVPKYVTRQGAKHKSKFDTLEDIMRENYAKDKNHIYRVEHPHKDVTIIPAKYVDELQQLPDEKVNFLEDIDDASAAIVLLAKFTDTSRGSWVNIPNCLLQEASKMKLLRTQSRTVLRQTLVSS